MSYILDALNKSEQERRSQDTPNLDTVHRVLHAGKTGSTPWVPILVVLVILNTLIAIYWYTSRDTRTETPIQDRDVVADRLPANRLPADPLPTQTTTPALITSGATVEPEPEPAVSTTERPQLITPEDYFSRESTPEPVADPPPVRFSELPLSVQQQIPEIRISSHIYGTDPAFRMANINDRIAREGDMITDSITLDEITEDGVVLKYLHYRFEMRIQ
jgi:general secretion pathway protein B